MRHNKKGRKLGTSSGHTKAMKKSLVGALFTNDRIKTVEARAKEIRPDVDKIITWAKKGDLHSRRLAIAALGDKELVREVFEKVEQGQFGDRQGGYTRILKLGNRKGDNAPMVIMELVTEPVGKKKKAKKDEAKADKKAAPKKTTKKAAAKKEEKPKVAEDVVEELSEDQAKAIEAEAEATEKAEAKEAKEEGFDHIAFLFEEVAKIEKEHEERYLALKASLDAGTVFARETEQVWVCTNCGHVHIGTHAPEVCPVCEHPQAYFVIQKKNY